MITRTRNTLPLTGLRAVHDARTRIFAAGRDPMFTNAATTPRRTIRVVPAFPEDEIANSPKAPLWRPEVIDRLQSPLTRHRD